MQRKNNYKKLTTGFYQPSEHFRQISEHTAVSEEGTDFLVAVTGPSGDGESEMYAKLFAKAPALRQVLADVLDLSRATARFIPTPSFGASDMLAKNWDRTLRAAAKLLEEC